MDALVILNCLFFILGGIAVFMVGMEMMGKNLETAAGKSMRKLMGKASKNRFVGVGTGAAITAIVNSSAATTVMIVGFVNVGFMTLTQAASVIMGANIGTTISAFIMALSSAGGQFSVAALFALVAFGGFVVTIVSKRDKIKRIGNILEGIGLIFIGLNVMSGAVKDLMSSSVGDYVADMFVALGSGKAALSWEIPVLFILGALLTAAMQSSAALTALVISLATPVENGTALITLQMAMCIILGANVGTCLTSLISSMGTTVNAKRTAMIHLLFNVAGCFIFIWPVAFAGNEIGELLSFIPNTQWQIAVFHMCFNLITTAILMGFIKYIVKLACLIVPDRKGGADGERVEILDERLLKTPAIAVGQVRKEIVRMAQLAFTNYKRSVDMLLSGNTEGLDDFAATESEINSLNKYITQYLVKLSSEPISETDEKKVSSFYHVTSDIERIGDYAENITEFAQDKVDAGVVFSQHAEEEIREMDAHVSALYKNVEIAFANHNLDNMRTIMDEENATDEMCKVMHASHIRRTNEGRCTPEAGTIYLQLAVTMERIGDHMFNVANSVKAYTNYNENRPTK